MRALTAMLNHRGGRVLFGVEADGREVLAVSVPQGQSRPYIYDDRLEITSSGSLHFGLTPDA
jgi:predicted HTH transcriptional regulator